MEAHKERKEQVEKEQEKKRESNQISNDDKCKREVESDTMAKIIIRENTISSGERAQDPNDVLAFSRSVHNIDSSLE